jgi:hypothetical protein
MSATGDAHCPETGTHCKPTRVACSLCGITGEELMEASDPRIAGLAAALGIGLLIGTRPG